MSNFLSDAETKRLQEKYQASTIGAALIETLEEMHLSGDLTGPEAQNLLGIFDKALAEELNTFDAKTNKIDLKMEGHLDMYRFDGHTWMLDLEDVAMEHTSPPNPPGRGPDLVGRIVVTAAAQPSNTARKITKKQ